MLGAGIFFVYSHKKSSVFLRDSPQAISGHIRLSMPVDLGLRLAAPLQR